jgi:LysR family transcriptional regulator for metE and metH
MLERTHLQIIQEVENCGSLTAAAERMHLTQSALSHTMSKLEKAAGIAVWRREGRNLRLTQAGRYLLGVANRLLPQLALTEERLRQYARGERGTLRIGMECHPCYQWLLKVVSPYLEDWPSVDVDVKQRFQFGGIGALFDHEIDLLVTPDPLRLKGLVFYPVFDYEQVLVVCGRHALAKRRFARPEDLAEEVLITYPVAPDRLDIFNQFLAPAGVTPRLHKTIETTDIMLQMVASNRGVAAMPRWLVDEYAQKLPIVPIRLGKGGIAKKIHLGIRQSDAETDYVRAFITSAKRARKAAIETRWR